MAARRSEAYRRQLHACQGSRRWQGGAMAREQPKDSHDSLRSVSRETGCKSILEHHAVTRERESMDRELRMLKMAWLVSILINLTIAALGALLLHSSRQHRAAMESQMQAVEKAMQNWP